MYENALLDALLNRYSTPAKELTEPAPSGDELQQILKAGMTAPDHGLMRPWEIIVIQGEARLALGELLVQSLLRRQPDAAAADVDKQRAKPLRSPLILAIAAKIQRDNPKVPEQEQILSAGCVAQHIQLAAQALGYGSVWLTGPATNDWSFAEALGLGFDDRIVAFIYLGTPKSRAKPPERPSPENFLRYWHGPEHP